MNKSKNTIIGIVMGIVIMSAIIGVVWIGSLSPNEYIESFPIFDNEEESVNNWMKEEENETIEIKNETQRWNELKFGHYSKVADNHASNYITESDVIFIRNIAKYGSKYYFGRKNGNDYTVHSTDDFTIASVLESTKTEAAYNSRNIVTRQFSDDVYSGIDITDVNEVGVIQHKGIDVDGVNTWSSVKITDASTASNPESVLIDIINVNSKIWWVYLVMVSDASSRIRFMEYNTAFAYELDLGVANNINKVHTGYMDGSDFKFLFDDGGAAKIYKFTGATNPTYVETLSGMTPFLSDAYRSQYWKDDNAHWFINGRKLWYYDFFNSSWQTYDVAASSAMNCAIWDKNASDNYIIKSIVFYRKIYEIFKQTPLVIQDISTMSGYSYGYGDWIVASDGTYDIYQLESTNKKDFTTITFHEKTWVEFGYPNAPIGEIWTNTTGIWNEGDVVNVYDRANNKLFPFMFGKSKTDGGLIKIPLKSLIAKDFERILTLDYTSSASSTDTIHKAVIAKCEFIKEGTIAVGTTGNYTPDLRGLNIGEAFLLLDNLENFKTRFNSENEAYYNNGQVDSTINCVFGTDVVMKVKGGADYTRPKTVTCECGMNDGVQISKIGRSTGVGFGNITLYFKPIINTTEAQTIADNQITYRNVAYKRWSFRTFKKAMLTAVSMAIDFYSIKPLAANAKYYVNYVKSFTVTYHSIVRVASHVTPLINSKITPKDNASDLNRLVNQVNASGGEGITPNGIISSDDIEVASGKYIAQNIIPMLDLTGINGWTESYLGWYILRSDASANIGGSFHIGKGGSFKLKITYFASSNGGVNSGVLYGSKGQEMLQSGVQTFRWDANNVWNALNFDLDIDAGDQHYIHYKLSAAFTLADNDTLVMHWDKDNNDGTNNLYIQGMTLVRQ